MKRIVRPDPCYDDGNGNHLKAYAWVSTWRPSFWDRLWLLLGAKVRVSVLRDESLGVQWDKATTKTTHHKVDVEL